MSEDGLNGRRLLLDSNLLLLLIIGAFDLRLLNSFKRLSDFSANDFRLLRDFASSYRLLASPHIFTEVSNLANSLPQQTRSAFLRYFASAIPAIVEPLTATSEIAADPSFASFGLTDAAVCQLSRSALIMTQDGRLRSYLDRQGAQTLSLETLKRTLGGRTR
jgi:hypothetical protein